jgi:hypothetical protein
LHGGARINLLRMSPLQLKLSLKYGWYENTAAPGVGCNVYITKGVEL